MIRVPNFNLEKHEKENTVGKMLCKFQLNGDQINHIY